MSKAEIIRPDSDSGGSICRCMVCRREFKAGGKHYWHNHFYCSEACAISRFQCPDCGKNQNFCGCREGSR